MEWSDRAEQEWSSLATNLRSVIRQFIFDEDVIRRLGASKQGKRSRHEWNIWSEFEQCLEREFTPVGVVEIAPPDGASRYSVDGGYNGSTGEYSKTATVPANTQRSLSERRVIPNFIVHVPGHNESNLLAIEVRKSDQQRQFYEMAFERAKMVGYTWPPLNYRFALYLCLGVGDMFERIHAICLPHRSMLKHTMEPSEMEDLQRSMGACIEQVRWLAKKSVVELAEKEMAEIQSALGFREVTNDLLTDGVIPIPKELIRFPVDNEPPLFRASH